MRIRRLISSSLTVAVLLAGGLGAWAMTSGSKETYTVTADLSQAPNLFAGGRVMVRGVEVGMITAVTPRPDHVRIAMDIEADVRVPKGARLSVVPITVIADRYIQFTPAYRGGAYLKDGDHIGIDRTSIPAELDEVLTQLDELLSALEPRNSERRGPLADLIAELDKATRGRSVAMRETLDNSALVLENLADSTSDITGLIQNLDRLFVALAGRSSEIGLINERFRAVAEALAADRDALEGTIENLEFLSTQGSALVDESGDELALSFGRLDRVLRAILRHQDELAEGAKWTNVIAEGLGATDSTGRGLFAYSGRSDGGPEYDYRLDGRDTIGCNRIDALADVIVALGNSNPSVSEIRASVLEFIPDEYHDDLEFLVDQLIVLCVDVPIRVEGLDLESTLDRAARLLGRARLEQVVRKWLREGVPGVES